MKKLLLFLCVFNGLMSCSTSEDLLPDQSSELANIVNSYEMALKGYSLDEMRSEKNEDTPSGGIETIAEPWLIKALQDSLAKEVYNYSKTCTGTRATGTSAPKVGVFKMTSCGSYPEFSFDMDCEDGGHSSITGNVGATKLDKHRNLNFFFCLVEPGNYGGGTLLLYDYKYDPSEGDVDVVKRFHDTEDGKNANKITNNGGLTSTGHTQIGYNVTLYWRFSDRPRRNPYISYGVIRNDNTPLPLPMPGASIFVDDEDKKNANEAILWSYRVKPNHPGLPPIVTTSTRKLNTGETFRGITADKNTTYRLTIY